MTTVIVLIVLIVVLGPVLFWIFRGITGLPKTALREARRRSSLVALPLA